MVVEIPHDEVLVIIELIVNKVLRCALGMDSVDMCDGKYYGSDIYESVKL